MIDATEFNNHLVEAYFSLLRNLSVENKLDLIAKLSVSIKKAAKNKLPVEYFHGAWESPESAETLVENIRGARIFNRKIEEF